MFIRSAVGHLLQVIMSAHSADVHAAQEMDSTSARPLAINFRVEGGNCNLSARIRKRWGYLAIKSYLPQVHLKMT